MMFWVLIWCLNLNNVNGQFDLSVEYPNPLVEWRLCGQQKTSYICDPDFVLDRGEVEKLDQLAEEMKTSTKCLCSACPEDTAIQIGIYLKNNISQELPVENPGNSFAETLRKTWNLGTCNDDIIIILITQLNISGFSMGSSVKTILPEVTAAQILKDCQIYFDTGYYYEGLESIVNSFNDLIIREQMKSPESYRTRELLIGLLIGFSALFVITSFAFAFHFRQVQRRKQSCSNIYEKDVLKHDRKHLPSEIDEQLERLNEKSEVEIEDV